MLCRLTALALVLAPLAATAEEAIPPAFRTLVEAATASCAAFDGGTLTLAENTLSRPDLNGDGVPDWALDESGYDCSSAASFYCGSGGCSTSFLIDGTLTTIFGYGWDVVRLRNVSVLLVQIGGTDCGLANAAPCVRAMVWDKNRWNTQPSP